MRAFKLSVNTLETGTHWDTMGLKRMTMIGAQTFGGVYGVDAGSMRVRGKSW